MSETDDDYQDSGYPVVASLGGDDKDMPQNKKRKIQRACDVCRRKKVSNHLDCRLFHLTHTRPPVRVRAPCWAGWPLFHGRLGRPDLLVEDRCRCIAPSD